MFTYEELTQAYFDCRRNKRNTHNALQFEQNLEDNLISLYHDLNNDTYEIGRSICFVVTEPKPREIWATDFRDRVVHHLLYNRIAPKLIKGFIQDSYACIPNRGNLYGVQRVNHFIRSATQDYTNECYYLQIDIKNFFVSIDKQTLQDIVFSKIKGEENRRLLKQYIWHDPSENVYYKSPSHLYNKVPSHKRLRNNINTHGLGIGNLPSQLLGNLYLNELDQYIKRELKVKYYGRYVDDMVIIHHDPKYLNYIKDKVSYYLFWLGLQLHPNKTILNKTHTGINYVGYIIKHHRIYIRNRTLKRYLGVLRKLTQYENHTQVINSYLGMMKHSNSYNIRNFSLSKYKVGHDNFSKLRRVI